MSSLEAKLAEQQKVIEFLTSRYEKDTGRKLPLPTSLGHLLGDPSILGDAPEVEEDPKDVEDGGPRTVTFMEHVENLKLPKLSANENAKQKGGNRNRQQIKLPPQQMLLQKIDVSGFGGQKLSRAGFRELIDGVELLPSVKSLNLSNNNITDDFQAEILAFFDMTKIKAIDLSRNHMKKLGGAIGKKMRDEISHLKWIDLTMNDFDNEPAIIQTIISGLKRQGGPEGMQHIGLTVQEKMSDQLVRMVQPKKPPMSLNLRNSKLADKAFDYLCKCLTSDVALTGLSLKFCFLSFEHCIKLADALQFNKSLIRLDLSNNGLKSCTTRFILDSLLINQTLSELSFANNFLDNAFARDLAYVLESN